MIILRHQQAYLKVFVRTSGLATATYGGDMVHDAFSALRGQGLLELQGAASTVLDVRGIGPYGLRLAESVNERTFEANEQQPMALLVRPEHALEWSRYAIQTGLHGVTRVIFTDQSRAYDFVERRLESWRSM